MSLLSYSKKKLHKAKINNFLGTTKRIDGAGEDHHHGIWIHRVTYIQSSQPDLLRNKVKRIHYQQTYSARSSSARREILQDRNLNLRKEWKSIREGICEGKRKVYFFLIN